MSSDNNNTTNVPPAPPAPQLSDRGKGRKGIGKKGAKRHRPPPEDPKNGVKNADIRRMCRRGGVKRISGTLYEESRGTIAMFIENVIKDVHSYARHARRKTITAVDIVYALKRQGITLYGFGV